MTLLVLAGAVAVGVPAVRRRILQTAGWALVLHPQPINSADIIVIAVDTDGAGTLEAADLVHSGVATKVAVSADLPDAVGREFIRRGLPYEDAAAISIRQLRSLGVDSAEQIPRAASGSEDEGRVLADWCNQHHYRSVVIVTTSDHSRRLRRILRRSIKDHQTSITVQPARYSQFDPERWWETRGGVRTEIFEVEKLVFDLVRHPI